MGSIGTTPNEAETGKGVDSLPTSNPVQSSVLNQQSIDAARGALNQLSGEILASAKTALIDEIWLLRAAINDRVRTALGAVGAAPMATLNYGFTAHLAPSVEGPMPALKSDRFAGWGQGYGSWGRSDRDGNAARLMRSTGGLLLGADAAVFDHLRFGIIAGYSRSEFDVNNRFSSGESDNYHLGLYGGGQWGALNLRAGASYTWHDVETRRAVNLHRRRAAGKLRCRHRSDIRRSRVPHRPRSRSARAVCGAGLCESPHRRVQRDRSRDRSHEPE
ncbi:autotransporter domain-containing protein [Boseaceae bacterium BT-24-1]|nr:autotransporter domain-containing protein [Boseaceae bacterium BT-24-1]